MTGPVQTRTSAWRGEPFRRTPKRSGSNRGISAAMTSISQPLHEPLLKCNSHGDDTRDHLTSFFKGIFNYLKISAVIDSTIITR